MKITFSCITLIIFFNSCSIFNSNNNYQEETNHRDTAKYKIYQEQKKVLNDGLMMIKKGLINNQDYCLHNAINLQEKAAKLKEISEQKSFVNLAISANHLEICTSCNTPTAKDHCKWAADTLKEMSVMYGWN
jgi:hypothetical protein